MSSFKPVFIPGQTGDLFAVYYPPADGRAVNHAILHVPAFAEEMNKSRRMVAMQARAFSEKGYAVLVFDLFGTGDSAGEFADAGWSIWQQDILSACQWLQAQGAQTLSLWSLRTGALLAMDFLSSSPMPVHHWLAWQPVLNGDLFVMQFLRLRVAAAMMDKNAPTEKTSDLKQQLQSGQAIEVAGYMLNPALINPLMACTAEQFKANNLVKSTLLEVVSSLEKGLTTTSQKLISHQQNNGHPAVAQVVLGSPFWSTQEIVEAPELITETLNCFS